MIHLILFAAVLTQDATKLADGELLPVKIEAADKREMDALTKQIADLQKKLEDKYAIRAKSNVPDDRVRSFVKYANCSPDVTYEVEWRGDWMLVTKRVGSSPCSFVGSVVGSGATTARISGASITAPETYPHTGSVTLDTSSWEYAPIGTCLTIKAGVLKTTQCPSEVK